MWIAGGLAAVSQARPLDGTWRLIRVGSSSPQYYVGREPCAVPTFEQYTFQAGRWSSVDTFRLKGPNGSCAGVGSTPDGIVVRSDSGTYRIAADSVHISVADSSQGVHGWVGFALLKGDTLRFPRGEFDPGDYVFVRVHTRRQ